MTNEQWKVAEQKLKGVFGNAKFLIDGYQISIDRHLDKGDRLVFMIYVNGFYKGVWGKEDPEYFKFQNKLSKNVYSQKHITIYAKSKLFTKAEIKEKKETKVFYYSPVFKTFATLKKTLIANNSSIQLLND